MVELPDILRRIVTGRRQRVSAAKPPGTAPERFPEQRPVGAPKVGPFLDALRSRRGRAVIAEVKLGSPRLGSLAGSVDPERQARLYAAGGAAALSVVVEPDFFFGSYELLTCCREVSGLPTLAKDFVVDPIQLEWAKRAGADAVLLIAAILTDRELTELAERARGLDLVPLIETHSRHEIERLAGGDWELVGINNRNLRSFDVDLERSMNLLVHLPTTAIRVAESGIRNAADIRALATAGFDAFLVGESLLLASDPAVLLGELVAAGESE